MYPQRITFDNLPRQSAGIGTMNNDNDKSRKFFGFEVNDSIKYGIVIVLAIILIVQIVKLF